MSDTPETDKAAFVADCWHSHVPVKFAENLERECNDLREIFPKILEALESGACAATCSVDFLREIPREVRLVRQRLERERDEARELAANLEISLTAAIRSANVRQDETEHAMAERDKAVRACEIWQYGVGKIVEDRDYWRAEAERWRALSREHDDEVVIDDQTAPYGEWWEVQK